MAADLARTPCRACGCSCGDAHAANFGAFVHPSGARSSTSTTSTRPPGPFEWDLKRLAGSPVVAARSGFDPLSCRRIVVAAGQAYRTAIREFAEQSLLQVWYTHLDVDQVPPLPVASREATQGCRRWWPRPTAGTACRR
jgi:hypothetical protein